MTAPTDSSADAAAGPLGWLLLWPERIGEAVWAAVAVGLDLLYLLANALGGVLVVLRTPYFWRSLVQQLYFT
ncbi:MAG: hypothetical protein HXX19_10030, partial [Rhodoferax sp.]|nr:hypothetical protein [Rhodoferax sp.]